MTDPALEEEIFHFLERLPGIRVVGAASDSLEVSRQIHDRRPEAIVASPDVAAGMSQNGSALLVVDTRETTQALRTAMRVGARGFYVWPDEREELGRGAQGASRRRATAAAKSGRVLAVWGARGGAGATFLATNLAAACTDKDLETVLVDLDRGGADVSAALGIPPDEPMPTIADLLGVAGELTQEHLDRTLHPHPRGFRVLLAPGAVVAGDVSDPEALGTIIRHLRTAFETVVLHLPRSVDDAAAAALNEADTIVLVTTLDVFAIRHAKRQLDALSQRQLEGRCRVVLNRVARGEIVPEDVRRALGLTPVCQIRTDPAVPRAQNRGELVAGRSCPAARRVVALAKRLLDEETR
ncbi:MAG TPA: hypothetical protein VG602_10200 [Actinomycetota bacterium]|nr:hypothetical protein [Actinomycetota bacterium]